tara:strand:- start:249 stop:839 length:591 start_codon:yes stop_codon:yes gene_type:complete
MIGKRTTYALREKFQQNKIFPQFTLDIFSNEELDYLAKVAKSANIDAGIGRGEIIKDIRSAKINWLEDSTANTWIFRRIEKHVEQINDSIFNYEISSISGLQLANYSSDELGKYDWHMDCGDGPIRKLSLVIQLSSPEEYEGGEFSFMTSKNEQTVDKKKGLVVTFPSFLLHRVSPVTSGQRQSLVCWINGTRPFS